MDVRRVIWLDEIPATADVPIGNKARTLGVLRRAGLPVPDGFCIPAPNNGREPSWEAILDAYRTLSQTGTPVTVRSSGLAEDGATASHAGQYETVLNVEGGEALKSAVERCRASAHSARVRSYRRRHRLADEGVGRLPVLVQRQLAPTVSGVLFTADPVTGERVTIIEAVRGLGAALLSGRATPARYRVAGDGAIQASADAQLLTAAQCRMLAALGRRIADLLGAEQDVEWALVGEEAFVLQARPIPPSTINVPLSAFWTRANVGEILPNVVTPLTWAVFRATLQGKPDLVWEQSEREDGAEAVRRVDGRVVIRLDALLDTFCYLPTVTPATMRQVLGVVIPDTAQPYTRPTGVKVRLAQALFWLDVWGFVPRLDRLVRRLPPLVSVPETVPELVTWTARCFQLHLKCTAYAVAAYGVVSVLLQRWAASQAETYLLHLRRSRTDTQTSAQGLALRQLAEEIRARPEVRALLTSELDDAREWQAWGEIEDGLSFQEKLGHFLEQHGARASDEFELAQPRWREDPTFVLTVLRGYLRAPETPPIEETFTGEKVEISTQLSPLRRRLLDRAVDAYTHNVALRESVKYRLIEGFAALRARFLDVGADLMKQDRLAAREEIFYLYPGEIQALQRGHSLSKAPVILIEQRKTERARWSASTPPALLLTDGLAVADDAAETLTGIGCSAGSAEGPARVIHRLIDAQALRPGEILVAPHTDPGWTPLFLTAGAVVTEIGGILSHAATVAREYGTPAVFNVPNVTQEIRTGDVVRVDGARGTVTVVSKVGLWDFAG